LVINANLLNFNTLVSGRPPIPFEGNGEVAHAAVLPAVV
jgi:hypothetical protein